MRKNPKAIDFEGETRDEIEAIKSKIGQEVPLSRRYTQGSRVLLLSITGETATIRFPDLGRIHLLKSKLVPWPITQNDEVCIDFCTQLLVRDKRQTAALSGGPLEPAWGIFNFTHCCDAFIRPLDFVSYNERLPGEPSRACLP